ncbi:MAG: flagellar biosynthesis protein FlhF [Desulfuromonadia bacterium]
MLVKTFRAADMSEALKKVKAELGADAMIISSRKEKKKGLLGIFSKPYFEVTAALDPKPAPRPVPPPYREREEPERTTREEFQNSMLAPLARELKDLREKVEQLTRTTSGGGGIPERDTPPEPPVETPPPERGVASLSPAELEELKRYLLQSMNLRPFSPPPLQPAGEETGVDRNPPADGVTIQQEIEEELSRSALAPPAIKRILDYIAPAIEQGEDREGLRYSIVEAFAQTVTCSGPLKLKKNSHRVVALVGPTGVGKTTTTAKLAAMYAMNKGASVALITTDNFRVGAVEQLKTYARIMDLPLDVVATPEEMKAVLQKHAERDLIIIDTAGRSPKDEDRLNELAALIGVDPSIEVHLCLSATTKDRELEDIVKRFSVLPVSRLLFTKLDESESLGCIVNTHLSTGLPLSYFTNGQMVPEDISMASARKLANILMSRTKE